MKLSLEEKGNIVFGKDATYITHRYYYNQKLVLFGVYDFLVQVYYDPEDNEISKMDIISTEKALKGYYHSIDLSGL